MAFLAVGLKNLRGSKRARGICLPMLEAESGSHTPLRCLPGASQVTRVSPRRARCEGCHCTGGGRFLPSPSPFPLSTQPPLLPDQLPPPLRFLSVKPSLPRLSDPRYCGGRGGGRLVLVRVPYSLEAGRAGKWGEDSIRLSHFKKWVERPVPDIFHGYSHGNLSIRGAPGWIFT